MEREIVHEVPKLIVQFAVILLAARISGELTERLFKAPGVLGELVAGMVIGPYALGRVEFPLIGALFPLAAVPGELYFLAQLAAILLLFLTGLETDLRQFLRYLYPSLAVALGGVILPFILGVGATVLFGYGRSPFEPVPLFVGAIMAATSVGITARVLGRVGKTNSPEGVTILAAAVIDDLLGVLILGAVAAVATLEAFSTQDLLWTGGKSLFFLGMLVLVGFLLSRYLDHLLRWFHTAGAGLVIPLGLAFLAAALAEFFGLAMIIGAYLIGLTLSTSKVAPRLEEGLSPLYQVLVPIFFVVMGMLVDFRALKGSLILLFGLVITLLAVLGKVVGAGLPALLVGFNLRGGLRVGLGMLPRGEVALIIAGVGITAGVIGPEIYSVAVLMTFITTLIAPVFFLNVLQRGGPGLRRGEEAFPDVCALEQPERYRYRFSKRWEARVAEEWRNELIAVLEERGLKRIRGVHGRECHLFAFEDTDGRLFYISEALEPGSALVQTLVYSDLPATEDYLREADRRYNERRRVSFL